jgi:hypothetical protein
MVNNQSEDKGADMRSYAAKHPRRMNASAMMAGMAAGMGLMAAKQQRNKSMMQKFMDRMHK